MEKIAQGAEAILYKDGDNVVKHRFRKKYREESLDKSLRRFRTRREGKVIKRLNELGIGSPVLHEVDDKEMKLVMSFLDGDLLLDVIEKDPAGFGSSMGKLIGKLHLADIIHGDITTANLIIVKGDLYFIDFGLSVFTIKAEDKAVELHLLRRALQSKHPDCAERVYESLIEGYVEAYPTGTEVLDRLTQKVSKRGRHKKKQ